MFPMQEAQSEGEKAKQTAAAKEAAGLEAQVARLLEALSSVVETTKAQVEKRAALTFEEHQAELAEAEEVRSLCSGAGAV